MTSGTAIRLNTNFSTGTSHKMINELTLKGPIRTAADHKFCYIFPNLKKIGMIFHENCLPADNSHEISCLICYF